MKLCLILRSLVSEVTISWWEWMSIAILHAGKAFRRLWQITRVFSASLPNFKKRAPGGAAGGHLGDEEMHKTEMPIKAAHAFEVGQAGAGGQQVDFSLHGVWFQTAGKLPEEHSLKP